MGAAQTYRLNSLFDPDLTGGGTQPYGFDTLATIYKQYKVKRVRIHMEVAAIDPTYVGTIVIVLVPSAITLPTLSAVNMNVFLDKPFTTYLPVQTNSTAGRGFTADLPINMIDGLTRAQLAADLTNYSAFVTADPTSVPRITFAYANTGAGIAGVVVRTSITYFADVWDRDILPQS